MILRGANLSAIIQGLPRNVLESGAENIQEFLKAHYPDFKNYGDWELSDHDVHPLDNYCKVAWPDRPIEGETPQERKASALAQTHALTGLQLTSPRWMTLPAIDSGGTAALHPLAAWWTILYTLSMLARYSPNSWSVDLDVDSSPYAAPIEELIAAATEQVPTFLDLALGELATP